MKNIQVEAWIIENKIDLEMYDKPPRHRLMEIQLQHQLDESGLSLKNNIQIEKVTYSTHIS